jgi:Ca-activated chloride channel family protein
MRPVAAAVIAIALAPLAAQQPVFKSGVQLVTVPVAVTNAARDQLITSGLDIGDFRLSEDGQAQDITLFSQERRAVSLCVVVDASGSMAVNQRLERGVRALQKTAQGLTEGDEIAIVRFTGRATTVVNWTRTPSPRQLSWRFDPDPGTIANSSITDAVKVALNEVERASNPRRVILVISDGYENASATPLSRVVNTRQQSEASLYAFGVGGPQERAPNGAPLTNILPALVGEAGGVYWNVATTTDAEFAGMSLLNELKYQYTLGYTPVKPFDGKYRRITVETTVQGLAVRHRGGYLALPTGAKP